MDGSGRRPRLASLDWLRGLVMGLMLLDHTRDFLHAESLRFDPTDLGRASTALFLTRWVTHLCAPTFALLAGLGIHFMQRRGRDPASLGRFLWTRGLWLLLCEFTLVRFGMTFRFETDFLGVAQVLWVLGASMVIMAGLVRVPRAWVLLFGLALVAGHHLLDEPAVAGWMAGRLGGAWTALHAGGMLRPFGSSGPRVFVLYPLLPWPGIVALGFVLGPVLEREAGRRRLLSRFGLGCVLAFVLLRAINGYGDPGPWTWQGTPFRTLLSFVNTCKYPPSLAFLLMTLGPALLLLAWRDGRESGVFARLLETYGRVPLFFYLLQWPTARLLGILLHRLAGRPPLDPFGASAIDAGFGLGGVYLGWILGLGLLYLPCRWFAAVKARRQARWLSYL